MERKFAVWAVFAAFGFSILFMAAKTQNQLPWVIAFFSYGVLGGSIVSYYMSYAGEERSLMGGVARLVLSWALVVAITVGYLIFTHQPLT